MTNFMRCVILLGVALGFALVVDACHGEPHGLFGPEDDTHPPHFVRKTPAPKKPDQVDTLEGRVTWKGELPKIKSFEESIRAHPDKDQLLKAPKEMWLDPTWSIDPKNRGVANVAVFIKRPKNGKLPIHPDDKIRKVPVIMEAPFSFYSPHVTVLFAEWFDGENRGSTGQTFTFRGNSKLAVDFTSFGLPEYNPRYGLPVPRKTDGEFKWKPQPLPINIQSSVHAWATAYVWVFDHPYFAITKDDGTFSIPRVPAGMEVQVMAWHEEQGWLFTNQGKTMKLTKGKNTLDIEMSAK